MIYYPAYSNKPQKKMTPNHDENLQYTITIKDLATATLKIIQNALNKTLKIIAQTQNTTLPKYTQQLKTLNTTLNNTTKATQKNQNATQKLNPKLKKILTNLTNINILTNTIPMAQGGQIPGTGNTDNVPALLTPGEFVIKKERTAIFGELLKLINFAPLSELNKLLNLGLISKLAPKINLNNLINVPESLPVRYAQGGQVPQIQSKPIETIRLEWHIGSQRGQIETLMGQRKQLNTLVNAINNVKRGL
jgi:hypothetical protein